MMMQAGALGTGSDMSGEQTQGMATDPTGTEGHSKSKWCQGRRGRGRGGIAKQDREQGQAGQDWRSRVTKSEPSKTGRTEAELCGGGGGS